MTFLRPAEETRRVYRLYDVNDALLYVGQTMNIKKRIRHHLREHAWGDQIATYEFGPSLTREEALVEEARQIKELRPRHNIRHASATGAVA